MLQPLQSMTQQSPIGIFDSGVGGLSIAKAINSLMPNEHIIYIADHLFSPYGNKSKGILYQRTALIVEYFESRNCKAIVVACNTATVHTISYLRTLTCIPIVGVEPALKPASEMSKTGIVGLFATDQTINSESLLTLKSRFDDVVDVKLVACPLFVDLVEQGQLNTAITQHTVKHYLNPLIQKGIDQLVLGCTHYAFLIPSINQCISELTCSSVNIIEPSMPVCLELRRQLELRDLLAEQNRSRIFEGNDTGTLEFYSTQVIRTKLHSDLRLNELFSMLWHKNIEVNTLHLP